MAESNTQDGLLPWMGFADPSALREVGDALPAGLLMTDMAGRITYWNRAAEQITGRTQAEALGASCRLVAGDRITGCACKKSNTHCPLLEGTGGPFSRCCTIRTAAGEVLTIFKNALPLCDRSGERIGAIETFVDVTGLTSVDCQAETVDTAKRAETPPTYHGLVGDHPEMQHLYKLIGLVGQSDATVMILGESGTGKELVAETIHQRSPRAGLPFVKVNCSLFNESLLESELFGHVRGAFTGAVNDRRGRFEEANGGTLLLDEIGDTSLAVQLKLLRVVQQREIERVGESRPVRVDVRLLCATHRDLKRRVDEGRFRADLYFRLNVFPLHVPPLRQHLTDLPALVEHFLLRRPAGETRPAGITLQALQLMAAHPWPGNVRELENAIEFACLLAGGRPIAPEHLPPEVRSARSTAAIAYPADSPKLAGGHERRDLVAALDRCGWHRGRTARVLGISRVTLWKRMKRLGIESPRAARSATRDRLE